MLLLSKIVIAIINIIIIVCFYIFISIINIIIIIFERHARIALQLIHVACTIVHAGIGLCEGNK